MVSKYFLDISASIAAGEGPVSGVIRVEREIARRMPALIPGESEFILFDLQEKGYFTVQPNAGFTALEYRHPTPVDFPLGSRVFSFGLESNTKCIRTLARDVEAGRYKFDSVLYDMTASLEPQLSIEGYGEYLRGVFADLLWFVDRYFAISEHSRSQLHQFCDQIFQKPPPCDVFPLGSDPMVDTSRAQLPEVLQNHRYGLIVSTIEARKNHYAVYRAWDRAIEEGLVDPRTDRLAFVGQKGWGVDDLLSMMEANPRTRGSIVTLSGLPDDQLALVYEGARFCMLPSFDEGYGLPVAEALRAGKLCLCSDRGAIPEVARQHAKYIDPIDILAWRDAIAACFAADDMTIARQARKLTQGYQPISWDESARTLVGLIMKGLS